MFLAVLISDLISLQSACPDSSSMLYWGLNISLHDTLLSSMFYLIIRGMATWQWQYILEADTLHSCAKCCLLLVSSSDSLVPDWLTFNDAASITISLLSLMHNNHSCFGVEGWSQSAHCHCHCLGSSSLCWWDGFLFYGDRFLSPATDTIKFVGEEEGAILKPPVSSGDRMG